MRARGAHRAISLVRLAAPLLRSFGSTSRAKGALTPRRERRGPSRYSVVAPSLDATVCQRAQGVFPDLWGSVALTGQSNSTFDHLACGLFMSAHVSHCVPTARQGGLNV